MSINQFEPWTVEEDKLLRSLLETARRALGGKLKKGETERIATLLPGRSKHSVEQRIWKFSNGSGAVERRGYKPWSAEEEIKLREIYSGEKWRINSKTYFPERDPRDIIEKARLLGLSRRMLRREAKELTEGQKGVLAGLIMGDGCLSHRIAGRNGKQHLNTIEFSNTDIGLVELFASMVTNCNVHSYQPKQGKWLAQRLVHYSAGIYGREPVENILVQILPYLAGEKLKKAKEMLICLRGGHN